MAHFATYDVVADAATFLSVSPKMIQDFTLGFAPTADFGVRSVLSYMVDPGSVSGVTFKMSVTNLLSNGTQEFKIIIPEVSLPSGPSFLRQEVIDAGTFEKLNGGIGVHMLRIHVTAGAANFSDIVHLYQAQGAML